MMQFFRSLLGAHGKKAVRDVTDAIVAFDPTTASAAQLDAMEKDLDKAGIAIGKLRVDAQRERREADEAKKRFDRLLAAGEHLNAQLKAEGDEARKQALNASLAKLVTQLEEAQQAVNTEVSEADEAEALLSEAEVIHREKAQALLAAKKNLSKAASDLQRAKLQEDRAKQVAESRAQMAGLRYNETGGLNAAVNAMNRQAEDARARADAARMKAEALSAPKDDLEGDDFIAAALSATSGNLALGSPSDRLAALSGRKEQAALPAPSMPALEAPKTSDTTNA